MHFPQTTQLLQNTRNGMALLARERAQHPLCGCCEMSFSAVSCNSSRVLLLLFEPDLPLALTQTATTGSASKW
jgi:hypothetical protein